MPSTARARPLHCGTCINDLAKKCEVVFDNKNPKLVCNSLKKLLSEGKKHRSNGDDEMAYIYLMRWLNCIRWLKKTPDCNQNKDFLKPYVSGSEVKDILNILEDITGRLEERYKAKRLKDCTKRIVDDVEKIQLEPEHANNDDLLDEVADIELNLPDTPTDDPVNRATETSITCMEMFHEMQKLGNRIIIFDIRSQENFQSSQIKGNRCVNIPADIIKPGISATNLFRSLNADQKTCQIISHRARAYCDLIVLLDWQTSKSSLKPANRLVVLKKILWDWDPGVAYQKIVVLDGGYKEWLNCFPAYTTNPSIIIPDITSNSIAEILEDVEYPDWVQSDEDQPAMKVQFKPVAERNLKPMITVKQDFIIKKSNTLHNENSEHTNSTGILSNDSISPSKFRADFPNDNFIDATSADTSPLKTAVNNLKLNHNSTVHNLINKPTEDEVSKPAIDRSSKPNTVKIYDADSEKMLNLLKQHSELVKSKMKLEDEKLLLEDQLFGREENEDNNSKQKVETLRHIEVLHATIIQKMKQIVDIKQKVNECKKQSIKVNPAHYDEEVLLQLNLGIAEHEAQTAAIRRRMFITERDKKLEENLEMREASISTPPKDSEMDTQKKTPQQDGTSMNGALKRSHSSPNLAQLETRKDSIGQGFDYKVPQVDRTSKPSHQQLQHGSNITNSTIVHRQPLRRDREQRMSPVFGNMVNQKKKGKWEKSNSLHRIIES